MTAPNGGHSRNRSKYKPILKTRTKYALDTEDQESPHVGSTGPPGQNRAKKVWFARPDIVHEIPAVNKMPSYARVLREGGAARSQQDPPEPSSARGTKPFQNAKNHPISDSKSRNYNRNANRQPLYSRNGTQQPNSLQVNVNKSLNRSPAPCQPFHLSSMMAAFSSIPEPPAPISVPPNQARNYSMPRLSPNADIRSQLSLFTYPDRIHEFIHPSRFMTDFERNSYYLDYLVHHTRMPTGPPRSSMPLYELFPKYRKGQPNESVSKTPNTETTGVDGRPFTTSAATSMTSKTSTASSGPSCISKETYIPEVSALGGVPT